MSALKAIRLRLEPDQEIPMFKRLTWDKVDASIYDVLKGGVHPWMKNREATDVHPSLIEAFLKKLNDQASKPAELERFDYCPDVMPQQGYYYEKKTRFERTLDHIVKNVYFVDDLAYLRLLNIAAQRLRDAWNHDVAKRLAEWTCSGFQELRRFLKSKDKSIKLSGRDDIERYDLGDVLSLEDFEGHDRPILLEAIPSLNFRRVSWLNDVADSQGRIKLGPDIGKITLTLTPQSPDYVHLHWHAERDGEIVRLRPEVGKSEQKRLSAEAFAKQWRIDEGRLCFDTTLAQLSAMLEQRIVLPSFPALNYIMTGRGPKATAELSANRVQAYFIGRFPGRRSSMEAIKEILREHGVPMTGNKTILLKKLAKLASAQYEEHGQEMTTFFSEQPFVRINNLPAGAKKIPLLEEAPLRNLLLTMFAMRHLRGNAILDVDHENNTYTEEQLAHALLMEKVSLSGAFLRVA